MEEETIYFSSDSSRFNRNINNSISNFDSSNREEDMELSPNGLSVLNRLRKNGPIQSQAVQNALNSLNMETYTSYLSNINRWAPSTVKKHTYAWRLYESFCTRLNLNPLPYSSETSTAFVIWLFKDAGLSYGTIEYVVIASLKRIYKELYNSPVSNRISDAFLIGLKQIKDGIPSRCLANPKRDAAIITDVITIIECIPQGYPDKAKLASLFLFSVSTGARAISCSSVKVGDIISVTTNRDNNTYVTIIINRTKGINHWNHQVTLEGSLNNPTSHDFVFWLNRYMEKRICISLTQYASAIDRNRMKYQNDSLWDLEPTAMSARFKECAKNASYPDGLFSFHSLRAGFLCSAILKTGLNQTALNSVLDETAFIAGWKARGRSQLSYVKTSTVRGISATRLVFLNANGEFGYEDTVDDDPRDLFEPDEETTSTTTTSSNNNNNNNNTTQYRNIIREDIFDPTVYHHLNTPLSSKWSPDTNFRDFRNRFNNYIAPVLTGTYRENLNYSSRLLYLCYKKWLQARNLESLIDEVVEKKNISKENAIRQIGRKYICILLETHYENIDNIFQEFINPIKQTVEARIFIKSKIVKRRNLYQFEKEERAMKNGVRVRIPWTGDETEKLLLKIEKYGGKWVRISEFFPLRSPLDLKDKWRNLKKIQVPSIKKKVLKIIDHLNNPRPINNEEEEEEEELEEEELEEGEEKFELQISTRIDLTMYND